MAVITMQTATKELREGDLVIHRNLKTPWLVTVIYPEKSEVRLLNPKTRRIEFVISNRFERVIRSIGEVVR